jgi:hypothetical protein
MEIRDELETYLLNALKQKTLNIDDLVFHSMMYGAEVMKHHQGLSPVMTFNRFHKNCICQICSRNDSYEKVIYALNDLIFLLFKDHIEEDTVLLLSPHQQIPSSEISGELCKNNGIKLCAVKKTKNPSQIDLFFNFVGYLETEAALRDLPMTFSATVDVNNPCSLGVFSSAAELMLEIVSIKFMDEYQLCNQNPVTLQSFFESLPNKFSSI